MPVDLSSLDVYFSQGIFYLWHQLLLHAYKKELHQCGYKGAHPYWDWTLDTDSPKAFSNSPIFDTKTEFSGNRTTEATFHGGGHLGVGGLYDITADGYANREWPVTDDRINQS